MQNGVLVFAILAAANNFAIAAENLSATNPPVTVLEDRAYFTLNNGILTARVQKASGDLVSLKYQGLELMGRGSGHPFGYWSHTPARGPRSTNSITIHPKQNGGERAEVSVQGPYFGAAGGTRGGFATCGVEIRYGLARGDSGIYTYSIFTHAANYPHLEIGEARFGAKLNPEVFDYLTIDAKRRKVMPKPEDWEQGTELNLKEARRLNTGIYQGQVEHKYDYSAIQFEIPAYGWSSSKEHVGLWFVNPSIEYLSGGATKVELTGHLDNNEGGAPTLLNYWRGSHYGGSLCVVAGGETWSKVIGPFLIYCNSADGHDAMWSDALSRAGHEAKAWPYDWVQGADYPHRRERGSVTGQLVLNDPQSPKSKWNGLLVGLAAPDYVAPRFNRDSAGIGSGGGGEDDSGISPAQGNAPETGGASTNRNGRSQSGARDNGATAQRTVDWQRDAKFYQFWVRGDERGRFAIPNVRPGKYTLHAIADGILGEAVFANVNVEPGRTLDLGRLQWKPLRLGRPLWEIGIPNRSAEEFLHGDHYWQWGLYYRYTNDFPNDVHFVVDRNDYRRDWNYAQLPRGTNEGSAWSITFNLREAPRGKATLRLGIAAASIRGGIAVTVNGQSAGSTAPLADTATIRRDGIRGYWSERSVSFDATRLHAGPNVVQLTIPPGGPMSGVEYDYLRLELDESGSTSARK